MGEEIIVTAISYFNRFENVFFTGYLPVMIGLLCCCLLLRSRADLKKESFNWIYILSTLVSWVYLINLLIYAGGVFIAWYGQNAYEWYAFSNPGIYGGWKYFFIVTIITFITALLFFIRKLRVNRWYIVFFLLIQNFTLIVRSLTSLYRDYLPSSWATYYTETTWIKIGSWLGFLLVIAIAYCICSKRKKLPYPSIILK